MNTPKSERTGYLIANALLLIAALLIAQCLSGCRPYEIAKRKYATDVIDTTFTNVVLTIPRDSVTHVLKTDTTRVYERVRQGRATVTIIREPTNTTVIANCDSARTEKKVVVKTVRQMWGVDPRFRDKARTWQTVAFVLIGLIVAGVIVYVFMHRFKISVDRRGSTAT